MRCRHLNADHLKPGDVYEAPCGEFAVTCEQFRCIDCGAWLSLGPSNDLGCFAEIEAARIIADLATDNQVATVDWDSAVGAAAYDADNDPPDGVSAVLWHIGWLVRHVWSKP